MALIPANWFFKTLIMLQKCPNPSKIKRYYPQRNEKLGTVSVIGKYALSCHWFNHLLSGGNFLLGLIFAWFSKSTKNVSPTKDIFISITGTAKFICKNRKQVTICSAMIEITRNYRSLCSVQKQNCWQSYSKEFRVRTELLYWIINIINL